MSKAKILTDGRRLRADRIFDAIWFPECNSVEDHEGWEFSESSRDHAGTTTWTKKVYLRGEDVLADTKPATFKLVFYPNSTAPLAAYLDNQPLSLP